MTDSGIAKINRPRPNPVTNLKSHSVQSLLSPSRVRRTIAPTLNRARRKSASSSGGTAGAAAVEEEDYYANPAALRAAAAAAANGGGRTRSSVSPCPSTMSTSSSRYVQASRLA